MNRIIRKSFFGLVALSVLFIPVRLGLSGFGTADVSASGTSMTDGMPPCHGGDSSETESDNCTEHCWRTAKAHRVLSGAVSHHGDEMPPVGFVRVLESGGTAGVRGFDLDYVGKLVLKKHVSTVVLRD